MNGDLSDGSLAAVAEHLANCIFCEKRIDHELRNAAPRFASFPSASALGSTDQRALDQMIGRARKIADDDPVLNVEEPNPLPQPTPRTFGRYRVDRLVGAGSFGHVFAGHDPELQRQVAIKVPRHGTLPSDETAALFLREAQAAARLQHSGIVPVYDVGRCENGSYYVVFALIDGATLRQTLRNRTLTVEQSTKWMIEIASALDHAHQMGLVHRDLKPANVLIDSAGNPLITDFGLALLDQQTNASVRVAGTPNYMAPEQIRGETHRLDARTDVWALGVIFYQMLCGHRPFFGNKRPQLCRAIVRSSPKPLTSYNQLIDAELERICLRCLSKRMDDRYPSAAEFVADLQAWQSHGDRRANLATVTIVPKGLRAFTAEDAGFFVHLLPGPRDRHGIPQLLRFWKRCLDARRDQDGHSVNVLFGPSGSGKSSFVRAGLLPALPQNVATVILDASADTTESRLLEKLQHQFGDGNGRSLDEYLGHLRSEVLPNANQRMLIVLDQFEQWLHSTPDREPLTHALRQFDADHLKALIIVRDDFWMETTRLFHSLELDLIENGNAAACDLFRRDHAREVLISYGRALGRLPKAPHRLSQDQLRFVERAIEELAEEAGVVPVRLVMFAEMTKEREWTATTFREIGGTSGVAIAFLDSQFGEGASRQLAEFSRPARELLRRLMPASATTLKGEKHTTTELQAACQLDDSKKFQQLIHLLDHDLHLISPVEVDSSAAPAESPPSYQLTHDALVPAIRDWIDTTEQSTLVGRARQRLKQRTESWTKRNIAPTLPTWEWCFLSLFARGRPWTSNERSMFAAATRQIAQRAAVWVGLFVATICVAWSSLRYVAAQNNIQQIASSNLDHLPHLCDSIANSRSTAEHLKKAWISRSPANAPDGTMRNMAIAIARHPMLANDEILPEIFDEISAHLDTVPIRHVAMVAECLPPQRFTPIWDQLATASSPERIRRLGAALAIYAPDNNDQWRASADKIVGALVHARPSDLPIWLNQLASARHAIFPAVHQRFAARNSDDAQESVNLAELAVAFADSIGQIVDLVPMATPRQIPILADRLNQHPEVSQVHLSSVSEQLGPLDEERWLTQPYESASPRLSCQMRLRD